MPQPSTQDIVAGFDPTGYGSITGAGLLTLVNAITPYIDAGFVKLTTDVGGVPQVPDANTNIKWRRYIWLRILATSVSAYVWNPSAASDATFLQWQSLTSANIPDLSITNNKLADSSVTDRNIVSVSYAKVSGPPTSLPPNGAAGGDLVGTYPNPTIGPAAVTNTKIGLLAVNPLTQMALSAANTILRMNAGGTAWEAVLKLLLQLAEPVNVTNSFQNIRVKSDASGFEYHGPLFTKVNTLSYGAGLPAADTRVGIAHTLGAIPLFVSVSLKNLSAELGYSIGDLVPAYNVIASAANTCPVVVTAEVGFIYLTIPSALTGAGIRLMNKDGVTGPSALTRANWGFEATCAI